jgi:hypothetical protein
MARHPSLGVIIGLTHNLAPSTPGRFGGHLRDLTQWKEIAFLSFLRLKSYLTQIERKRKYGNKDSSAQVSELFVAFILCHYLCLFLTHFSSTFAPSFSIVFRSPFSYAFLSCTLLFTLSILSSFLLLYINQYSSPHLS